MSISDPPTALGPPHAETGTDINAGFTTTAAIPAGATIICEVCWWGNPDVALSSVTLAATPTLNFTIDQQAGPPAADHTQSALAHAYVDPAVYPTGIASGLQVLATWAGTNGTRELAARYFTGIDPSPVDGTVADATGAGTAIASGSATPSVDGCLVYTVVGTSAVHGGDTPTSPSQESLDNSRLVGLYRIESGHGSAVTNAGTITNSTDWAASTVIFKPGGSGATPTKTGAGVIGP